MILGIDEVGRGPWAGPLVVGACVLGGAQIDGLTDSKKLSKKQREKLNLEIREKAAGFGLGWVDAATIDEIGLSKALIMATKQAVEQIKTPYNEIIIDGTVNFLAETTKGKYVTVMKKADLLVPCVSAASIIAKVARDDYMAEQAKKYECYGFEKHVGYGTAAHMSAIDKFGVTPLHRLSFKPLKKYLPIKKVKTMTNDDYSEQKTTKEIGDSAETIATKYLIKQGHKIIGRNWKTKYCEIDIISKFNEIIYFTEVKYRKQPNQGGGLSAITPKKLKQMKFAAEYYVLSNKLSDIDLRLAAISLGGEPPLVELFLEA
jgi:ribonuclease HII